MSEHLHDKIFRINCLTEDTDSLYHQAALKLGVSDSALFVLYITYTSGGQCLLYDICRQSGISKQTINSAIRSLEKDGIIYLENHNGKSKIVCFTEEGKAYAQKTAAKLFNAECSALSGWTEEEINTYLRLFEKYNDSLRKQLELL